MFQQVLRELKEKQQDLKDIYEASDGEDDVEEQTMVLGDLNLSRIPKLEAMNTLCSEGEKMVLKNRFQPLVIDNKFQDVKLFQENIIECHWAENNRIDAILKFNGEKCFVGITSLEENSQRVYLVLDDRTIEERGFTFDITEVPNC